MLCHLVSGYGETGDISEVGLRNSGRRRTTASPVGGHSSRAECSDSVQGQFTGITFAFRLYFNIL